MNATRPSAKTTEPVSVSPLPFYSLCGSVFRFQQWVWFRGMV